MYLTVRNSVRFSGNSLYRYPEERLYGYLGNNCVDIRGMIVWISGECLYRA